MFVVRKLDRELTLVFGFRDLIRIVGLAESEARVFARSGAQVTDGANRRPTAAERLAGEELLPVTTNACVMIGKICNVGKFSLCGPGRRDFMTGVAGEAHVLFGRMKKGRVLGSGSLRSLRLR